MGRKPKTQKAIQSKPRPNDRVFRLIKPQSDFVLSNARYPAYVAAWATGKSLAGIGRAMRFSEGYKGNLGVIFRKEFTDLRDSTVKDFEDYTGLKVDSKREVSLENGSIIMFRHLEELNNIQNINLGWFWIEQAEELDTDDQFFTLFGRLRRKDVPQNGFITANTKGNNWIKKLWKAGVLEGGELIEAKTEDNKKNLSIEFLQSLEILKEKKPGLYRRMVLNSWEDGDIVDSIVKPEWVRNAGKLSLSLMPPIRRLVSIDVARYGDDKTVFYSFECGGQGGIVTMGKEVHEKKSTMETVGLAQMFAKKHKGIKSFAVDEIGVGGGVGDRLAELGYKVHFVNSSSKSSIGLFNLRAEIYQNGANLLEAGNIELLEGDDELKDQLTWARYKAVKSSGTFQVEGKDDIKKRNGRSPDDADSWLMGAWAVPRADVVYKEDAYRNKEKRSNNAVLVFG